ncbi:hypothetical protein IQ07DRAFT_643341 [Pyrenochaeta sp. DS3sAY3a]|nr:hypothetical protein IQ07DRAFT_643341 [Pyrenochaeta sp. DS3sAY3a]
MNRLKAKASRFFRESPSQDEKVANTDTDALDTDFDAGIPPRSLKHKSSRFLHRNSETTEKPLPAPPSRASSSTLTQADSASSGYQVEGEERAGDEQSSVQEQKPLPYAPASTDPAELTASLEPCKLSSEAETPKPKSRPSLAALRSKSSRIFRRNTPATHPPPPPLPPQISVDPDSPPIPLPPRSALRRQRGYGSNSQRNRPNISRPMPPTHQPSDMPIPENHVTVPFTRPAGPPPPRPPRPASIDEDTLALMRDATARMVLPGVQGSASNTAVSTPRPSASSSRSIETRLGIPSGHGAPRAPSLEATLAAPFPQDAAMPLPIQNKDGSFRGYSGFTKDLREKKGEGMPAGTKAEETGPIERFAEGKDGDWVMEKRVSKGPNGNPGVLWRHRSGGWHFVPDV